MTSPEVRVKVCPEHRPRQTTTHHTGPAGVDPPETVKDAIIEVLECWRCWESDEAGVVDVLVHLNASASQIEQVRRRAFSKKGGADT